MTIPIDAAYNKSDLINDIMQRNINLFDIYGGLFWLHTAIISVYFLIFTLFLFIAIYIFSEIFSPIKNHRLKILTIALLPFLVIVALDYIQLEKLKDNLYGNQIITIYNHDVFKDAEHYNLKISGNCDLNYSGKASFFFDTSECYLFDNVISFAIDRTIDFQKNLLKAEEYQHKPARISISAGRRKSNQYNDWCSVGRNGRNFLYRVESIFIKLLKNENNVYISHLMYNIKFHNNSLLASPLVLYTDLVDIGINSDPKNIFWTNSYSSLDLAVQPFVSILQNQIVISFDLNKNTID